MVMFFFFQAEDGIRDGRVTGVQTCALPICLEGMAAFARAISSEQAFLDRAEEFDIFTIGPGGAGGAAEDTGRLDRDIEHSRSEERRVGKECRSRWWP